MSEMIERLARDFAAMEAWVWESLDEMEDTSFGWSRNHIRQRMYSTVKSMRVPTEAMTTAGSTLPNHPEISYAEEISISAVWQAMIDAALQDTP